MKHLPVPFAAGLLLLITSPSPAAWLAKADFSACGHGMPPSGVESFATQSECQARIAAVQPGMACGRYWCEDSGGGDAAGGGADASLQQATSKALAEGLVHGDSQTFGVGLLGLGAMALLNGGDSGPSPAEIQAQQEAQRQRQARLEAERAAAAERKRRFDADKADALQDIKGGGDAASGGDDDDGLKDLKDAPNDPPRKKVKIIHLKPTQDPLHQPPLPGDSTKADLFDNWDDAKACGGTAGLDKASGKVACCAEGFPYFCGGRCYREDALDSMRVPCDSALTTSKQDLGLK